MKKNKYILSLLLMLGITSTSCSDFLDVNNDPNNPTSISAESFLPTILFYGSQSVYDHAEYGVYLAQAVTTAGKSQSGAYAHRSGWDFMTMSRHPQWRRHYYDIGTNVNSLLTSARAKNVRNYELVARTIRLMSTLYTTDMFGAMPLSDAYNSISPKYDEQIDVYNWMYTEVDELLKLYDDPTWTDAATNVKMGSNIDRIYGGDLKKWRSFTYALKARIYLRKLPNWDPSSTNCQIIIDACDEALKNWTEPDYNYPSGSVAEKNCPWGPAQPKVNSWESYENQFDKAIPTKYFVRTILGLSEKGTTYKDPRLPRLMKRRTGPAGSTDAGVAYRYSESNIGIPSSYTVSNYPNLFYTDAVDAITGNPIPCALTKNNGYISLMLTEELYLIKAEALYWNKDKEGARQAMINATTINLNRHGVVTIQQNNYLKLAEYFPAASDLNIGHIMRQKYVCMYLQPEQWNDMRRYKYSNNINKTLYDGVIVYPDLRRPYNLLESIWGGNDDWIQRINYDPQTEPVYNKEELVRLGAYQNPEWLKKPMIWAE